MYDHSVVTVLEGAADYIEEYGHTSFWARGCKRCMVGAMREVLAPPGGDWGDVSPFDGRIVAACQALGYKDVEELAYGPAQLLFYTRKKAVRSMREAASNLREIYPKDASIEETKERSKVLA